MNMEQQRKFSCDDVQAVLSGLLDGELAGDELHAAEVHLVGCEACRVLVNEAEEMDAGVRAAVEAGEGGWTRDLERQILFAVNDPAADFRKLRRWRFTAWSGWGTAAAALVVLSFSLVYPGMDVGPGLGDGTDTEFAGGDGDTIGGANESLTAGGEIRDDEISPGVLGGGDDEESVAEDTENRLVVDDAGESDGSDDLPIDEDDEAADLTSKFASAATNAVAIDVLGDVDAVHGELISFPIWDGGVAASASLVEFDEDPIEPIEVPDVEPNRLAVDGGIEGGDAADVAEEDLTTLMAHSTEMDEGLEITMGLDEVLYDASVLLRALGDAEVDTFTDLREINQVLEYDDVLERLASSRDELWGEDALVVDRAWAVLERVSGPIDQGRLMRVQELLARNDLAGQLEMMSDEYGTY